MTVIYLQVILCLISISRIDIKIANLMNKRPMGYKGKGSLGWVYNMTTQNNVCVPQMLLLLHQT